jgi:hypothetical protein
MRTSPSITVDQKMIHSIDLLEDSSDVVDSDRIGDVAQRLRSVVMCFYNT